MADAKRNCWVRGCGSNDGQPLHGGPMTRDPELFVPGTVWLVGAGPGDADLLTRKAEKLICSADVILYDALVGRSILELASTTARLVGVGKRSGRHSRDQNAINRMLLEEAHAGHRVVRLKGRDPSIFGRSGEELSFLREHGITARVCPGITAASAAAASAGVSLTQRGMSHRLELITAHARAGGKLDLDWAKIAGDGSTLAVYMGRAAAALVARNLLAAGCPASTPALVVENASLPTERLFSTRLDLLPLVVRTAIGDGPAILLIGESVRPFSPCPLDIEEMVECA